MSTARATIRAAALISMAALSLPALAQETRVSVSPENLRFTHLTGAGAPVAQTVRVGGSGSFTATGSVKWIRLNASSDSVEIEVSPDGLPSGIHLGRVRIVSGGQEVEVPVALTVTTPLMVAPPRLDFHSPDNTDPENQTLTVTSGVSSVPFTGVGTTRNGGSWLRVDGGGSTPGTLQVGVSPSGLAPGTYEGSVAVYFSTFTCNGTGFQPAQYVEPLQSILRRPDLSFPMTALPLAVAFGDFNGDGAQDMAVADSVQNKVRILLRGEGDAFTTVAELPLPASQTSYSIAAGDLDGDGKLDVAVAGDLIQLFLGDGAGGISEYAPILGLPALPGYLGMGDWNNDGQPDLLFNDPLGVSALLGTCQAFTPTAVALNAPNNPQTVPVTLVVGKKDPKKKAAPSGRLFGSPDPLTITVPKGYNKTANLNVAVSSGAAMAFTASSGAAWLTVNTNSGTTPAVGASLPWPVTVNTSTLSLGGTNTILTLEEWNNVGPQRHEVLVEAQVVRPIVPSTTTVNVTLPVGGSTTQAVGLSLADPTVQTTHGWFASESPDVTWISLAVPSGTVGGINPDLDIPINATGLEPGTYSATLNLTMGCSGCDQTITVNLTVTTTLGTNLNPPIDFYYDPGSNSTSGPSIPIYSGSGDSIPFSAAASQTWLTATANSPTPGSVDVTVNAVTAARLGQTFNESITVSSPNASAPLNIPITVAINPSYPVGSTNVNLVDPANGATGTLSVPLAGGFDLPLKVNRVRYWGQSFVNCASGATCTSGWDNTAQPSATGTLTIDRLSTSSGGSPQFGYTVTTTGLKAGYYIVYAEIESQTAGQVAPFDAYFILDLSTTFSGYPATMTFNHVYGAGSEPAAQSFTLSASPRPTDFFVLPIFESLWLDVTPAGIGLTPQSVTVAVTPIADNLAPGVYTDTLEIIDYPSGVSPSSKKGERSAGTQQPRNGPSGPTIGVTLNVLAPLTVTPASLIFNYDSGSPTNPVAQDLTATTTAPNPVIIPQATASTSTGGAWLSVPAGSGLTPRTISVSASPVGLGLAVGTYTGNVAVPGTDTSPAVVNVPVTLRVRGPMTLSNNPVNLTGVAGGAAVNNAGNVVGVTIAAGAPWTTFVVTDTSWVTATPSGTSGGGVTITANPGSLAPGTYSAIVQVQSILATAPQNITVNFTVTAPLTASVNPVALSGTSAGASVTAPLTLSMTGNPALTTAISVPSPYPAWLSLNPSSGLTAGTAFDVVANPASLPPGLHTATITFNSAFATAPVVVTVNFTVAAAAMTSTPGSLSFSLPATGGSSTQNIVANIAAPAGTTTVSTAWVAASTPPVNPVRAGNNEPICRFTDSVVIVGGWNGTVCRADNSGNQRTASVGVEFLASNGPMVWVPLTATPPGNATQSAAIGGTPVYVCRTNGAPGFALLGETSCRVSGAYGVSNPFTYEVLTTGTQPFPLAYTVTAATSTGGAWLSAPGGNQNTGSNVAITANPAITPGVGTYNGTLTLNSSFATSPLVIPVTLVAQGTLTSSSTTYTANLPAGSSTTASQSVTLDVTGLAVETATGANAAVSPSGEWLSATIFTGGRSMSITVNPSGRAAAAYTGTVTITSPFASNSIVINVTMNVITPTFTFSPTTDTIPAAGGTRTSTLTINPQGAAWIATRTQTAPATVSNPTWISMSPASGGNVMPSPQTVTFTVQANTSVQARTAVMAIGASTYTITQAGAAPSYAIFPLSDVAAPTAGTGTFYVTATPADAPWTATANDAWITIVGPTGTAQGSQTLTYSVAANTNAAPRTGTITAAGQTFTITQAGNGWTGFFYSRAPLAGDGTGGFSGDGGAATLARLATPTGLARDTAGNLYIADRQNNRVRRVGLDGIITTYAGSGTPGTVTDGTAATSAGLSEPVAVAFNSSNNTVYIAEAGSNRIVAVDASGLITNFASLSYSPAALAVDAGFIYVAGGHQVWRYPSTPTAPTLIAGTGTAGFGGDSGPATSAQLHGPSGLAFDGSGNLYITDTVNHRVRRVVSGTITTFAGTGVQGYSGDGGAPTAAQLDTPVGIVVAGADVYVSEALGTIRQISGGVITTAAGLPNSLGTNQVRELRNTFLTNPDGMVTDGVNLFVSERGAHRVRQIGPGGYMTVNPTGHTFPAAGGTVTVDVTSIPANIIPVTYSYTWPTISAPSSNTTGNATTRTYSINSPNASVTARSDVIVFLQRNFVVSQPATPASYTLGATTAAPAAAGGAFNVSVTVAPPDAPNWFAASNAPWLNVTSPTGAATGTGTVNYTVSANTSVNGRSGTLSIAGQTFTVNQAGQPPVYELASLTASVSAAAGSGSVALTVTPADAPWSATGAPTWLTFTPSTGIGSATLNYSFTANNSVVARSGSVSVGGVGFVTFTVNQAATPGTATIFPATATAPGAGGGGQFHVAAAPADFSWAVTSNAAWITVTSGTGGTGPANVTYTVAANPSTTARQGTITAAGNTYTVTQAGSDWTPFTVMRTVTGVVNSAGYSGDNGVALGAQLSVPRGVAYDGPGNLYIADTNNNRVRRVGVEGRIITFAGNGTAGTAGDGGQATAAQLGAPVAVAWAPDGSVYIADAANGNIRKVNTSGVISTFATLAGVSGLATDSSSNLYAASTSSHRVTRFLPGGEATVVAGTGTLGFSGDGAAATAAQLNSPEGLAVDAAGNLYIADAGNNRVRVVAAGTGVISTFAGNGTAASTGDGGAPTAASLNYPVAVAVSSTAVFIGEETGNRIRRVESGIIGTLAGTGANGASADGESFGLALNGPRGMAYRSADNVLAMSENSGVAGHRVRTLSPNGHSTAPSTLPAFPAAGGNQQVANLVIPSDIAVGYTVAGAGFSASQGSSSVTGGVLTLIYNVTTLPLASVNGRAGTLKLQERTVALSQTGATATYSLSPTSSSVTAAAGSGSTALTATPSDAPWSVTGAPTWLTVTPSTGTGSATLSFSFSANQSVASRTGTFAVGGQTYTLTQGPETAVYSLASPSASVSAAAGSGSVALTVTPTDATWTVSGAPTWLTVTPASGTGSATLNYSFTANASVTARPGSFTVGGQTFTVNQAGEAAVYSLAAPSASVSAAAGSGTVALTATPTDAPWTVTGAPTWLTVTPTSGTGSATLNYSFTANASVTARNGSFTVGGQTFTVNQAAQTASYSLASPSASVAAAAGSGSVALTATPSDAPWSVTGAPTWLTVAPTSGTGSATLNYTFTANNSINQRTGSFTVGGQTFTVTQAPETATYAWAASTDSLPASGGSSSNTLTVTPPDAAWTVGGAPAWLTVTPTSGTGTASVGYSAAANASIAPRTAILTAGGQSFTVTQAGETAAYSLSSSGTSAAASGVTRTVTLTATPSDAPWSVTAPSWVTVTPASGTGTATLNIVIAANTSAFSRSGTVSVGGQSYNIGQSGADSVFDFTAGTAAGVSAAAGSGSAAFTVTPADTPWVTISNAGWLTVAPATGAGSGTLTYTFSANTSALPRTGDITVASNLGLPDKAGQARSASLYQATLTVTQAGVTPTFGLTPNANTVGSAAGSATTALSVAPSDASWAVSGAPTWLTVTPGTGTGPATLTYNFTANPSVAPRVGTFTVGGQTFTLTQNGATPTFSLTSNAGGAPATAGSNSVGLTVTPSDATWAASSLAGWLTVTPATGTGSATINYTFTANNSVTSRTGQFTVGGQTFTLTQSGATASFSLGSAGINVPSVAGSGSFGITSTVPDAPWTATSNAAWLTVTTPSGTGSGSILFAWAANPSANPRTGVITTPGGTFTVTQAGAAPTYTVAPVSASVPPVAGSGSFTLTYSPVDAPVAVAAQGGQSWLSVALPLPPPGTAGSQTVNYNFTANATTVQRTATITAGTAVFTVTQLGLGTGLAINPVATVAGPAGGAATALVSASSPGAVWQTLTDVPWVSVTFPAPGTGSGAGTSQLQYTVQPNTGGSLRTGNITAFGTTLYEVYVPAFAERSGNFSAFGQSFTPVTSAPGTFAWRVTPVVNPPSTGCVAFPTNYFPFTAIETYAGPVAGDFLVVGTMTPAAFTTMSGLPLPAAANQKFCGVVNLGPGVTLNVQQAPAGAAPFGYVVPVAGTGTSAFSGNGIPATTASLMGPEGLTADAAGNIYIADTNGNQIRRVSPDGIISLYAGTGAAGNAGDGGPATAAQLNQPMDVALDSDGNLYIAERLGNRIRRVAPNGTISTYLSISAPSGVVAQGSNILVTAQNQVVRYDGEVQTVIAGTGAPGFSGDGGPATAALLNAPIRSEVDAAGNIYIADRGNNRIRRVDPSGTVSTFAGTGTTTYNGENVPQTAANLSQLADLLIGPDGTLYASESSGRIRAIAGGLVRTFAGTGSSTYNGDNRAAQDTNLNVPSGLGWDGRGLVFTEFFGVRVRRVQSAQALLSSTTRTFTAAGGTDTVNATTFGFNPTWVPISGNTAFLTVAPASLNGSGTVTLTATANTSSAPRNTTVTMLEQIVNVTQAGASAALTVTPSAALAFASNGTLTQSLAIATPGLATTFTATAATTTGGSWLAVSPATGVTPGNVTVTATPGTLAPGTYNGSVTITAASATGSPVIIPVTLTVNTAITLSPPAISVNYTAGAPLPPPISVTVNAGGATTFTAAASTSSGGSWLSVTPATGATGTAITVTVNPAGLGGGTYSGTITVTSPFGSNSPVLLPVTLVVDQPLIFSAPSLNFNFAVGGSAPTSQTFTVTSSGPAVAFTVSPSTTGGGSWLTVTPTSGTTPTTMTVTVNPTGLAPGTYSGSVTFTVPGGSVPVSKGPERSAAVSTFTVPVTFTVTAALTAAPASLNFTATQGVTPAAQTVSLTSTAAVPFSIATATTTGGAWLTATPATGVTPGTLNVSVATGLAPGTYNGTITVTAATASNSPLTIPVTYTVNTPVGVSPLNLNFTAIAGAATIPPQNLSLSSTTPAAFTATVATVNGGAWLSVAPASGTSPATLVVTANPTGLAAGTYNGTVTIVAPGLNQVVPVVLTLGPPPTAAPASLTFTWVQTTAVPAAQTVAVTSSGIPVGFTATAATVSGGAWLAVSPGTGTTPGNLNVSVSPSALAAGTYSGTVTVTTGTGTAAVAVTLHVVGPPTATPAALNFTFVQGNPVPAPQTLTLGNNPQPIAFTAAAATTSGGAWLSVAPASGTSPATLTVSAQVAGSGLGIGTYNGTITVTTAAGNRVVPVTLTVQPQLGVDKTSLTFLSPQGGAPQTQSLSVNTGTANLPFTATAATATGGNWLAVTPASGNTPGNLTVTATPGSLPDGRYTGTVTINVPSLSATFTVQVQLDVARLAVDKTALVFNAPLGAEPPLAQTLNVTSPFPVIPLVSVRTDNGGAWLQAAGLGTQTPTQVTVTVNPAGLTVGTYTGVVVVSGAATVTVPVTLNVTRGLDIIPGSLEFSMLQNGPNPAPRVVSVVGGPTGTAIEGFLMTTATETGGAWLRTNSGGGTTPAVVQVTVDGRGVLPGIHRGSITVSSPTGGSRSIPVTLTVAANISIAPATLAFEAVAGSPAPAPQALALASSTPVAFETAVATTAGGAWLAVTPATGTTPTNLSVAINPTGLNPGVYTGTVSVIPSSGAPRQNIPVTLTVRGPLSVDKTQMEFNSFLLGPPPEAQLLSIQATGAMPYTVELTSTGSWLTLSPGSGTAPATVTVRAVPANLAVGIYPGNIRITSPLASNPPVNIPVTLNVLSAGDLRLAPASLSFTGNRTGTGPIVQAIQVTSTTIVALPFTLRVDGNPALVSRLEVTPQTGNAPTVVQVRVDPTGMTPGPYEANIRFRSLDKEYVVPVRLTVLDLPPQLVVTPTILDFTLGGLQPRTGQFPMFLQNTGGGNPQTWSVDVITGQNFLTVSPAGGQITGPAGALSLVQANAGALIPGFYTGALQVRMGTLSQVIPVTLTVLPAQPVISLEFTGVQFEARAGDGGTLGQDVGVNNAGGGTLNWTATVNSGSEWLSAVRVNATRVRLQANAANLRPGTYYGSVQVQAPDAANSPQLITAVINVVAATTPPVPLLSPGGLLFIPPDTPGAPIAQTVTVSTASATPQTFRASVSTTNNGTWLRVAPTIGQTSNARPGSITVTADPDRLAPGVYTGTVSVWIDQAVVRTVTVTLVVPATAATPPRTGRQRSAGACTASRLVPVHTGLAGNFVSPAGWPTPVTVRVVDDCGAPASAAQVVMRFSRGEPRFLTLARRDAAAGTYTGTWVPAQAAEQVTMTAQASQGTLTGTSDITGTVGENSAPTLPKNSAVGSSVGGPLAPGSIVQIYGNNLAPEAASAPGFPLPTDLNGTRVLIGGIQAPLYYVSKTQINALIPLELEPRPGYPMIVTTGSAVAVPDVINLVAADPTITAVDGVALAQREDGSGINGGAPARPGEKVVLLLTGMGAVEPAVRSGDAAPGAETPARVRTAATLTVEGRTIPVEAAILAPGSVGQYQVVFTLPADIATGDLKVQVAQGGRTSNTATLPVRAQ